MGLWPTGFDLDCGGFSPRNGMKAVNEGKVKVAKIDRSLRNLYVVLMRLGWFDGSPGNYSALGRDDICSPQNLKLAAEAARQGIVLLKNDNNILPLNFNGKNPELAVVGPHTNATIAMIGNYALNYGRACRYSTPLGAIGMYGNVRYAPGCFDAKCGDDIGILAAVEATKGADATFLFVGLDLSIEREGLDRVDLKFPGNQEQLMTSIIDAATGHVIVVIILCVFMV